VVLPDGLALLGQRFPLLQRRDAMVMGFLAYPEIRSRRRGETDDRQHKGDRESKDHRAIVVHETIRSGFRTTGPHVTKAGRECAAPLRKFSPAPASSLDHGVTASDTLLVQHHDGKRESFPWS
jgi:hypothetical protein